MAILELFETRYWDFTVKHFHEKLVTEHGLRLSYTWTKNTLQAAGKVKKAERRGAHRRRRPRRPLAGMLLHQDGSRHAWVAGRMWDVIVTMDDATGEFYLAFFIAEEGTMSSFRGLGEVIERHGLFCALQDRLPKELRLAGITAMDAANRYLAEVYLPARNPRFALAREQPGLAFVVDRLGAHCDILCVHEERQVGNDNCVRYRGLILQIPADRHRHVKARVRVQDYPDGYLAAFHGPPDA